MAKNEVEGKEKVVMPFPAGGIEMVTKFRGQIAAIEEKAQLYIDGVIAGLGITPDQNPVIDAQAMTITFEKKEESDGSKS